jgi:hypothetical protein
MTRYAPLWNQALSYSASLDRSLLGAIWPTGGGAGAPPAAVANTMNVSMPPGWLAVALQSGQGSAVCRWDANEVVTLTTAPPSGQSRIDLVVCQVRDNLLDSGGNNDFVFTAVTGVPAASSPAVPAVPANAAPVVRVPVAGAAANLNSAALFDVRPLGHCEVYQAAAQGMPNTAWQQLFPDTIESGSCWDNSAGGRAFVCPMPGRWQVNAAMTLDRSTLTFAGIHVRRNNAQVKVGTFANVASVPNPTVTIAATVPGCAVGDVLTIWGQCGPAANLFVSALPASFNYAAFQYLGP